ncbi:MAG: EndoU domain-containing protein [Chitinophagaceae bacterium]|nr:EndoU domain-containing protein [Chitinophagaceae bacterium]
MYDYDLISGKVNMVTYQPDYYANNVWKRPNDQFFHRYSYDAENRLTLAETSSDKMVWERDARYSYYKHGPLARVNLGELQVQGVDYAYTLQGWLKGVNSTSVNEGIQDMGGDGRIATPASPNNNVARDAYGFSLNYFNGDYKSIGGSSLNTFTSGTFNLTNTNTTNNKVAAELFNGNIAAMAVNIPKLGSANVYGYKYDQLNRILSMDAFTGLNNVTNTFTAVASANYKERVTYDANGNIKTYLRNGDAARQAMDDMTYSYKANTNQLDKVVDVAADDLLNYANYNDIKQGQNNGNYQYDAIGNLISDVSEGITNVNWNVYGKIQSITKTGSTINYTYDASGNRISKQVTTGSTTKTTWYVRDASGNVMGVYTKEGTAHLALNELHLYGSSRLGILNTNIDMQVTFSGNTTFERGNKFFELSNHLGNVLVTISDKKFGVDIAPVDGIIDYYKADVVTANDYYPFGMNMPGRKFDAGSGYRYGFNGQEKSDEIAAGLTTALYWEYDSRIGRRWNLDPVPKIGESEYACFGNNPIYLSDPSGNQPDPPGKKSKGYDYAGALRSANVHLLAARVALFTYEVRAKREQYNWKLNEAYQQAAKNFSVTRYQEDNVAELGISQAAFTKIVSDYYVKFEKAFNYAADETMKELKFIYYNKYSNAKDIFKPNLTTKEAHYAISANIAMLDDMCDGTSTIAAKWQEVIDKCFMFVVAWSSSGIGSGVGASSLTTMGLSPNRVPSRTYPQMPTTKQEVDLVGFRRTHILNRHKGGTGMPGKTEFPSSWSDDEIINAVNKIANDPNATGGVGKFNSPFKTGTINGIEIRVDFYPTNHPKYSGQVSTAYPINAIPND